MALRDILKAAWANFHFGSLKQSINIFAKAILFCLIILLPDVVFPFAIAAVVYFCPFLPTFCFTLPATSHTARLAQIRTSARRA